MATAHQIIKACGGPAKLAKATGFPLTTVASWQSANFIPAWRQSAVIDTAKAEGAKIKAKDFPSKSDRIPRIAAPQQECAA